MNGYFGKFLKINLTDGQIEDAAIGRDDLESMDIHTWVSIPTTTIFFRLND